ncbi:uncharacterized protein [Rutidosis leptorrhynchoides]|uniref:uncharacterized protein n=1 Tax=Rutidosis leptorrhynchoides TaxID=125765 RepID=UPI003A99D289
MSELEGGETWVTQVSNLNFGDPLYLHPSDTSTTALISLKLKGTENYNVWSRAMLLALQTKNKLGFIDGSVAKSETDNVLAMQWDRCNSVVLSWILTSISEDLFSGQVFSQLAKTVWDELKKPMTKLMVLLPLIFIKVLTRCLKMAVLFLIIITKWKQFDALVKLPSCTFTANAEFKKYNDLIKLMQFLMGLYDYYVNIRSNILMQDPLPNVQTAFSIVSREESHKNFSKVSSVSKTPKSSFLVSKSFDNTKRFGRGPNPNLKCTKCNKTDHTIERCYEIVGFPPGWVKRAGNSQNFNKSAMSNGTFVENKPGNLKSENMGLSNEQMMKLIKLINDKSGSGNVQANAAGTLFYFSHKFNENFKNFFKSNVSECDLNNDPGWIIDSGASQHMTGSLKSLKNVFAVSKLGMIVGHPNGTVAQITKVGDLQLTNNITLNNVLVVPGYCVNLNFCA